MPWPIRAWMLRACLCTGLLLPVRTAAQSMPDAEVAERLRYLTGRLHAEGVQARLWQAGWSTVNVAGVAYGSYQVLHNDGSDAVIAEGAASIVKSLFGAAQQVVFPLKAGRGALELTALPDGSPEQRLRKLLVAEALLERNAREFDLRFQWRPHVISLVLNLAGGVVVGLAGDWGRAAGAASLAVAMGELSLWTMPWQGRRYLRDYRRTFATPQDASAATRRAAPPAPAPALTVTGGGVVMTF